MNSNNNIDLLKSTVEGAHKICKKLPLQEAREMTEKDVLQFLNNNKITEPEVQDAYLNIIKLYEFVTGDNS